MWLLVRKLVIGTLLWTTAVVAFSPHQHQQRRDLARRPRNIMLFMGIHLEAYAARNEDAVQLGKRLPPGMEPKKEMMACHRIYRIWRDSEDDTWPIELQQFWCNIYDYRTAQKTIRAIRHHYGEDGLLLEFADWLDQFEEGNTFSVSY